MAIKNIQAEKVQGDLVVDSVTSYNDNYLFNLSSSTIYTNTISASTIVSGTTNLYDIFVTSVDGNDITRVQPGLNTYTAGTENNPSVNISAATLSYLNVGIINSDILYESFTATTLSYNTGNTVSATTSYGSSGEKISTFTYSGDNVTQIVTTYTGRTETISITRDVDENIISINKIIT